MAADMSSYLDQVTYALDKIIEIIWHEVAALEEAEQRFRETEARMWESHDHLMKAPVERQDELWNKYIVWEKDKNYAWIEHHEQKAKVDTIKFSIEAASGSLLQYAKQGISIVFKVKEPSKLNAGRSFGTQSLANVIWQGRNQTLHWEEGKFRTYVENCFDELAKTWPEMAEYRTRNMAFDIVRLLKWRARSDVESDLLSIHL